MGFCALLPVAVSQLPQLSISHRSNSHIAQVKNEVTAVTEKQQASQQINLQLPIGTSMLASKEQSINNILFLSCEDFLFWTLENVDGAFHNR